MGDICSAAAKRLAALSLVTDFYDRQISCLVAAWNFSGVDAGLMNGVGHVAP
jgi:hypothetical protein